MKKLTQQEVETTKHKVAKYIRNNVKRNHCPGFLELKEKFRMGLHNYFKDILEAYRCAGVKYSRRNFFKEKQEKKVKDIRKAILDVIKKESRDRRQLTKEELEAKFKIGLMNYFKTLREAYKQAGVEFKPHFGSKTKAEKQKITQAILLYVKNKVENERYFPDIHELRRKFRIGTETYFPRGIREIIKKAGLEGEKFSAFWGLEKERRLLKIAQYILEQGGYKIISKENKTGPDIVVKKNRNLIPVELKAFRKNSCLPTRLVSKNPISQIRAYTRKLKSPFGIVITTAEGIHPRYKNKIPESVKILFYKDIVKTLVPKSSFWKDLEFIRTTFPNFNSETKKERIRQRVIEHIKKCARQNRYPITREIQKEFKINLLSYFKNIFEVYRLASVKYPEHKKRMSGRKPTEAEKEKIRAKIINFVKNRSKENLPYSYKVIQRELKVAIPSYFSSMQEIYKKAKVSI